MMLCDSDLPNDEHHRDGIKVRKDPRESQSQSLCSEAKSQTKVAAG